MQNKPSFFSHKHGVPKQGGGGGSLTWEKFPHFPVFLGGERPLKLKKAGNNYFSILCLDGPPEFKMLIIFWPKMSKNAYFEYGEDQPRPKIEK